MNGLGFDSCDVDLCLMLTRGEVSHNHTHMTKSEHSYLCAFLPTVYIHKQLQMFIAILLVPNSVAVQTVSHSYRRRSGLTD